MTPLFADLQPDAQARLIDANGARGGPDALRALLALPALVAPGGRLSALPHDDLVVRRFGDITLWHGICQAPAPAPVQPLRFTAVLQGAAAPRQLVALQLTPQAPGAPSTRSAGALSTPRWAGTDPRGDDTAVLTELNARYVQAFRESDIAWYDAHLAPDYGVSNGDGSWSDRGAALAAFAQPTFATHYREFPVDAVHIRRLASGAVELALVEAENRWLRRDGRRGISRYTDIWLRDGARWLCIAAHITPVLGV